MQIWPGILGEITLRGVESNPCSPNGVPIVMLTECAGQRTAPIVRWTVSLLVSLCARWARRRHRLPFRKAPWTTRKTTPSFTEMLAHLRRQSAKLEKQLEPLLDAAACG